VSWATLLNVKPIAGAPADAVEDCDAVWDECMADADEWRARGRMRDPERAAFVAPVARFEADIRIPEAEIPGAAERRAAEDIHRPERFIIYRRRL